MAKVRLKKLPSSFRDPDGFVFKIGEQIYRQINKLGKSDYHFLRKSGLYTELTNKGLLVKHTSQTKLSKQLESVILKPEVVPLITYPYEWSFSQLKEAALLTLEVQSIALEYGMTLKDASAYNVQFLDGKAVLIDISSLEIYKNERPWVAYRQFCEHFYSPLILMAKKDLRLGFLQSKFLDGIPIDLVISALSLKDFFNKEVLFHIYFHSLFLRTKTSDKENKTVVSKKSLKLILESLKKGVGSLSLKHKDSFWKDYYDFTNYSQKSFVQKKNEVEAMVKAAKPKILLDLGANTGVFSRIASKHSDLVVSTDYDPNVVESNFSSLSKDEKKKIVPLLIDLMNPSPGLGWSNKERDPFYERINADCVMALALLHHLVISNNLNFKMIAEYLSKLTQKYLIVEFVGRSDSQVKDLFKQRGDRTDYNIENFEAGFSKDFELLKKVELENTSRILYLYVKV